jgi:hypothetical protein
MRRIYNTFETVRLAVDRTVFMVGGREPQVVSKGATEETRAFIQRFASVSSMTKFLNHAMRDALVCGNGYFVARRSDPSSLYNLKPEEAVILGPQRYGRARDGRVEELTDNVMHLRGLEQVECLYGVSTLEVFGGFLAQYETMERASSTARSILDSSNNPELRLWAERILDQQNRMAQEREEHFRRVMPAPLEGGRDTDQNLYVEGFGLYPNET